jgi:integrase
MKTVPAPTFETAPVEPFTRDETHAPARSAGVEKLLKAAEFCRPANTTRRRCFVMRRPTAWWDRALILVLLDTGLRASEVVPLSEGDNSPRLTRALPSLILTQPKRPWGGDDKT